MVQNKSGSNDTPFNTWMKVAVDEMQQVLDLSNDAPARRLHLYRCFNALVKVMEEIIKAEILP